MCLIEPKWIGPHLQIHDHAYKVFIALHIPVCTCDYKMASIPISEESIFLQESVIRGHCIYYFQDSRALQKDAHDRYTVALVKNDRTDVDQGRFRE